MKPCIVCGADGGTCIQPVMFLGEMIMYQGVFCPECQKRLAHANRFLVEEVEGGGHVITPVDEKNRPLLQTKAMLAHGDEIERFTVYSRPDPAADQARLGAVAVFPNGGPWIFQPEGDSNVRVFQTGDALTQALGSITLLPVP